MYTRFALLLLALFALLASNNLTHAQEAVPAATYQLYLPLVTTPNTSTMPLRNGIATYYVEADGTGACGFPASPENLMIGAMNAPDYAGAQLCGAYVELTGPRGTITVRIVDRCPECQSGHIDLSPLAFARIAEPIAGRVPITWRVVSPPLDRPIRYFFKEGSNPWWLAVQIRNHRNPIAKVEYRKADGSWVNMPRESWNYFVEKRGLGTGLFTFRVTDIHGNVLTDSGLVFKEAGEAAGAAQFPAGP